MSHYTRQPTQFVDGECLARALRELFPKVELHEQPQPLYGYHGDVRPEKAHVIVRRQHVGSSSNDLGFVRRPDGRYELIVSEFDSGTLGYNASWLGWLSQKYAVHATQKALGKKFQRVSKTEKNGRITMKYRRVVA